MRLIALVMGTFVLGSVLASAAAAGSDSASASFEYAQDASLTGEVTGTVTAGRVLFDHPPESLVLEDARARFLTVTTTYNYTQTGDLGVIDPEEPWQRVSWTELPRGALRLDWPKADGDDVVVMRGPGYLDDERHNFTLHVEAENVSIGAARSGGGGAAHWWPDPDRPGIFNGDVFGRYRSTVAEGDGFAFIDSGFVLHVRQVRVVADGHDVVHMADYQQVERTIVDPAGMVQRVSVTQTDGFVVVDRARLGFALDAAQVALQSADWAVDGDIVVNGASGGYVLGPSRGAFHDETVALRGALSVRDRFVDDAATSSRVDAEGAFAVIAVDYIVEAAAPAGPSLVEKALWVTLVLGVLGALAWSLQHAWVFLYSRIKEDAVLDHPKRAEIMAFVEQNPGCHVLGLAEGLGLARGVARHHLMVLERAGRLRRFYEAGQTLLAPASQTKEAAVRAAAAEDPHLRSIVAMVAQGGMRRADLVSMLRDRHGVADPTARRWIDKAVHSGLIEESGRGHRVTYRHAS